MFEDRTIEIMAYNLETVLAEKLETVISRTTANTRMRDYYDIYILTQLYGGTLADRILADALYATARKRGTIRLLTGAEDVLLDLANSPYMLKLWERYCTRFSFASELPWNIVIDSVRNLCVKAGLAVEPSKVNTAIPVQTTAHKQLKGRNNFER